MHPNDHQQLLRAFLQHVRHCPSEKCKVTQISVGFYETVERPPESTGNLLSCFTLADDSNSDRNSGQIGSKSATRRLQRFVLFPSSISLCTQLFRIIRFDFTVAPSWEKVDF
jgi:hypothetical protein